MKRMMVVDGVGTLTVESNYGFVEFDITIQYVQCDVLDFSNLYQISYHYNTKSVLNLFLPINLNIRQKVTGQHVVRFLQQLGGQLTDVFDRLGGDLQLDLRRLQHLVGGAQIAVGIFAGVPHEFR